MSFGTYETVLCSADFFLYAIRVCHNRCCSFDQAKLAKLRRELLTPTSKGGGGAGEGFDVTKSGDARVGLVGFPSVGKSTLLNKLTGTFSEVCCTNAFCLRLTNLVMVYTYLAARLLYSVREYPVSVALKNGIPCAMFLLYRIILWICSQGPYIHVSFWRHLV